MQSASKLGRLRVAIATLGIAAIAFTAADLRSASAAPEDKPENYPDGPHRADTFYFCTACHSFKLVAQQGLTRDQWHDTLDWMEEKHALPKTEGKDRHLLLDYLSVAFPQKQKSGWQNPFQK